MCAHDWVDGHVLCVPPCGYTAYISKVLRVCPGLLMKMCSLLTWHLEQVMFWNKMFSKTETCVISQGQGGEEIYGVLRLTQVLLMLLMLM